MPNTNLPAIRIVLIGTSHPGNIGSAARAMKTMGFSDLVLVNPEAKFPCAEATALAAGADDILMNAKIVTHLDEAIEDCHLVMGTSARLRHLQVTLLDSHQAAIKVRESDKNYKIAVLFGREDSGLSNEELNRCHYHIHIPSIESFSSLNLAASVQILCYELRMAHLGENTIEAQPPHDALATQHEIELFHQQLEVTLRELDYLKASSPQQMLPRLRRLFNRTQLEKMEFDLLMGIFKALKKKADLLKKV